jgi:hypothetical protein
MEKYLGESIVNLHTNNYKHVTRVYYGHKDGTAFLQDISKMVDELYQYFV